MSIKPSSSWLTFFLLLFLFIALASLGGLLLGDFYYSQERFPQKTFIENIDVSLLSKAEATKKLIQTPVDELFATSFSLSSEVGAFQFKPSSLGVFILPQSSVDRAFTLSHQTGYFKELPKRLTQGKSIFPAVASVDEGFLRDSLKELALEINASSQDAFVEFKDSSYSLVPEVVGRELDVEKSIALIKEALKNDLRDLPIKVISAPPRIHLADLEAFPPVHILSKYTTYYGSHDSRNRISNIKLITSLANNYILLSGETFSLLSLIGEFSEDRGFKEAFVIVGDELVPEYGGGTCQIATTLYNAVALADLEVKQRKNHSIWFNIYPLGRDATVYPGTSDFRFANNTGYPVLLRAFATNRSLTFELRGTPAHKQVSFTPAQIEGKIGDKPFKTRVIRKVKQNGQVIKEEEIFSFYRQAGDRVAVKIRRPEPR